MKININKKAVGGRIKQIRTNKGYTLESFGKLFGASKSNVQKWETGFTLPNKERLASISKISDITVNELLYGSIDEFVTNNFENLVLDSQYPYPASFDVWKISRRFKIDSEEFSIDVNDLSRLQRFFNSYVNEEVEYILKEIHIYCDYFLENKEKLGNTYLGHMQSINLLDNTRNVLERSFKLDLEKHHFYDSWDFLDYSTYDFKDKIKLYVKYYPLLKELYNKMRISHYDEKTDIEKIKNEYKSWDVILKDYNQDEQQIILEFFDKLENKGTIIKENDFDEVKKIVTNRLDEVEQNGKEKVVIDLTNDIVNYYKGK
ncbi:helix-turn-helix domain-containing protein [Gemella cuniculi]|uniref:helix-turn-helix domain-containing protein n=1 Tax=Gemella cuniculi TaxID=150240 RepID=UPI0003FE3BAD|nr:helix-turn-helix transcriptional regulator [Gemella cuniculi]